jgi:hypothetical protein
MNGDTVRRAAVAGDGAGDSILPIQQGAAVAEVSVAVNSWVAQVGQFLGVLQTAIEETRPREDASAEVRALVAQLPALIRECRAQVPTPDMIRTWVRSLCEYEIASPDGPRLGAA